MNVCARLPIVHSLAQVRELLGAFEEQHTTSHEPEASSSLGGSGSIVSARTAEIAMDAQMMKATMLARTPHNPFSGFIATEANRPQPSNTSADPEYSGPPRAVNVPSAPPSYATPQDVINAQMAMQNITRYNPITNSNLDVIYRQALDNWKRNYAVNPATAGPKPVPPKFVNMDYEKELAFIKSQTPGDPTYGQDVGFDLSPYQQENYKGVIVPFTTANTNFDGSMQAKVPNTGKPRTVSNPHGLLPAALYFQQTGEPMPENGYGAFDPGYNARLALRTVQDY